MDPSGGLVNRPGVSEYLDEGFDQHRGDPVAGGPVPRVASFHDHQQMGAEVGDADPRQDEESRIVDHLRQVLLALWVGPADEAITRSQFPGSGGEARQGDGMAMAVLDRIAYLGPDQRLVVGIECSTRRLPPIPWQSCHP